MSDPTSQVSEEHEPASRAAAARAAGSPAAASASERRELRILPLRGIGEVRPGDDLAELIADAAAAHGPALADGDILVVTSKIVSKAEGRLVPVTGDREAAGGRGRARRRHRVPSCGCVGAPGSAKWVRVTTSPLWSPTP